LLRSADTLEEWQRVLGYPQFALDAARIQTLVQQFSALTTLVAHPAFPTLPLCRDPDDQKFLELAYAAGAQLLITRDKKLRKIGRHKFYRAAGLRVITLEAYLAPELPKP
jgi:uncharacterized protein